MKFPFFYILVILLLSSCSGIQAPEFKSISDLSVNTEGDSISINGKGLFFNPNKSKILLRNADIEVFINDQSFTKINKDFNLILAPESDFTIPLDIRLNSQQVNRFLKSNAVLLLLGNKIHIRYKGNIKVKAYSMRIKVPVDREISLDLKSFL